MKIIRELAGSYSSKVFLVEIDDELYVHKKTDGDNVLSEKYFHSVLRKNNIESLEIYENNMLAEDELLMEYIDGSYTLGNFSDIAVYKDFGKTLQNVHNITQSYYSFFDNGVIVKTSHNDFIEKNQRSGVKRMRDKKIDLTEKLVQIVIQITNRLKDYVPQKISLIHGDLHSNNSLIRDSRNIFFDVSSSHLYGDPYRDLALIFIEYYDVGDSYILDAILHGYDKKIEIEILDYYILLRAFNRYPNPFEKNLLKIIEDKIALYSRT